MYVRIRLFAGLRERAGAGELQLELPDGAQVRDALAQLATLTEGVRVVMAINREYADDDAILAGGDELALIPPVSGGSVGTAYAEITAEPLALDRLVDRVRDPRAGAVITFLGVTRDVPELEYEAYIEMAQTTLAEIVQAAIEHHSLCAAAVAHRTGTVALGEPSVAIAVSAPHRAQAYDASREIIDQIKLRAPIWKKEEGQWVDGVTPDLG